MESISIVNPFEKFVQFRPLFPTNTAKIPLLCQIQVTDPEPVSVLDKVNVRRLLLHIEKCISKAIESMLFEFNDDFGRLRFKDIISPYLNEAKQRGGIEDFIVICDKTNNPEAKCDRFVADIFIRPTKSFSFIGLNFIANSTSVSFDELVCGYDKLLDNFNIHNG